MERDPELQRLIDESKIRNLLNKYSRALDRQDHELLTSLYHPGAINNHGVYNGSATGYVDFMRAQGKDSIYWTHHNGTQIVEIERDIAKYEHTPSPSAVWVLLASLAMTGKCSYGSAILTESKSGTVFGRLPTAMSSIRRVTLSKLRRSFFYPCPLNACMTQDFLGMRSISGKILQKMDMNDKGGSHRKQIRQLCR
jgi:hypothetical protein